MDIITPVVTGALLIANTVVLTWYMRDRFIKVESDIVDVRTELKQDIADVRAEMSTMRRESREDAASVRSDILQLALTLGVKMRPETA